MTELLTLIFLYSLSNTSTLLNIFVVSYILYGWKETLQLSEGNSRKNEERNFEEKKRKETVYKKIRRKLSKNKEENTEKKDREETFYERIGRKHSKNEKENTEKDGKETFC